MKMNGSVGSAVMLDQDPDAASFSYSEAFGAISGSSSPRSNSASVRAGWRLPAWEGSEGFTSSLLPVWVSVASTSLTPIASSWSTSIVNTARP